MVLVPPIRPRSASVVDTEEDANTANSITDFHPVIVFPLLTGEHDGSYMFCYWQCLHYESRKLGGYVLTERIFNGVSSDNIDSFFMQMCISDSLLPHTYTRLSPITFQEFMARNNIMCLNQRQVYDAACMAWRMQLKAVPGTILNDAHRGMDYDKCEKPHPGWIPLIDMLNRVLDIENISIKSDSTRLYHQMHYLAHVSYLADVTPMCDDKEDDIYFRTMFRDCISPMLYPTLIPAAPIWAPVMMFTDMRFSEAVVLTLSKVSNFISTHCGRLSDAQEIDKTRLMAMHQTVKEALDVVHKNKYDDGVWQTGLGALLTRLMIIRADLNACEMKDSMERDGCKCIRRFRQLHKIKKMFDADHLDNNPETAIDLLLDTYADLKSDLRSYDINGSELATNKETSK